jgi:hypothetical protein
VTVEPPADAQSSPSPASAPEVDALEVDEAAASAGTETSTVGTGSYIAVGCTTVALLITFAILALLFLIRWLS